jgi:formylglycine-generating enzyme required for sulfatase activity
MRYAEEIVQGIKNTKIFLLLITENSINSVPVDRELEVAFNLKKIIIPFHLDTSIIDDGWLYYLGSIQRIYCIGNVEENVKNKLLKHIKLNLDIEVEKKKKHEDDEKKSNPVDVKSKEQKKEHRALQMIEMVEVKRGSFMMGSEVHTDENPLHKVEITYDYWMGKYPITFEAYDRYCVEKGNKKLEDLGWGRGKRPVIHVSWYEAIKFCNWLSKKENYPLAYDLKGNLLDELKKETTELKRVKGYRLPAEAEWEYAAKGAGTENHEYSGSDSIDEVAWYWKNSGDKPLEGEWDVDRVFDNNCKTHEVGEKKGNKIGLFDMSGNVWEWCQDYWDSKYYGKSKSNNPVNFNSASARGGGWHGDASFCRVANRGHSLPSDSFINIGFRVARTKQL